MCRNYDVRIVISKYFVLNWPRVVNFADIIKIAIIVIKTTFKASKKLKEVENIYQNAICISIS